MAVVLAAAATPLALWDREDATPEEEAIRATIVHAITRADPPSCTGVLTDRWLSSNFASQTGSATTGCREVNAHTVDVSAISLDGARATATVRITGGDIGRARLELALVEAERWRLDELTDIDVDRARFLAAQRQAAGSGGVHEDAGPLLRCMLDYAERHVSAAQIEESLLAGGEEFYAGSFPDCASEVRLMLLSPAAIGAGSGHSAPESRCISRLANSSIDDAELGVLFRAFLRDGPFADALAEQRDAAIARCTGAA